MKKFTSIQFNQLLEYLYDLQRLGIKVGLEHTEKLLFECGNPQESFRSIHIAGTNGKGSTAAMLASIFREAGLRVGLYTSPHLIRFNERVRVNGLPISDDKIVEFVSKYKQAIKDIQSTFFEATTALAFSHFAEENVDIAIIETGLGGRLDSTNVLKPNVAIITSITSDHTEILGSDLKQIASEKGGIIKQDTPLVLAEQTSDVDSVLKTIAQEKNAIIYECKNSDVSEITLLNSGTKFDWQGRGYVSGLIGRHQAYNAVLAIEATRLFENIIDYEKIKAGLANTIWPGRMQLLSEELPIYYDVAHNPHGIEIIIDTIGEIFKEKPIGVLSLKADKELDRIIPKLKNRFEKLIITSVPDEDLMNANELYSVLTNGGILVERANNFDEAVSTLLKNVNKHRPGLLFGSHYIGKVVFEKFGFSFDKGVI